MLLHDRRIGVGQGRWIVVGAVGNAKPATEVYVVELMAIGAQRAGKFRQQRKCVVERLQVGDLAADMGVDAGDLYAGQRGRPGVNVARALPGDAELVLGLAGRDLLVSLRIDIGIDA